MMIKFKPAHIRISRSRVPAAMLGLKTAAPSIAAALRGGASSSVVLQDFSVAAAGYFSDIRTPASLILGASLGALFVTNLTDNMREKSRAERLCTRFYNTCVLLSFLLSLCCTATATAAGVTLLHCNTLEKAESAYALLMRDFEFEFIMVRLSYLSSLLTFVFGITSRILVEYKLLNKANREEAYVVCFSIGALVTHLWSYINSTLYSSQSLFGLALTLIQIILRRAFLEHRPLQLTSLASATVATFFFTKVVFFKKKGKSDDLIL